MAEIKVPTLGESVTEATVAQWLKKEGDVVAADEPILELETDKVTLEVNAPSAGTLVSIAAKTGDTVGVGAVLGEISADGAAAAPKEKASSESAPAAEPAAKSDDKKLSVTTTLILPLWPVRAKMAVLPTVMF